MGLIERFLRFAQTPIQQSFAVREFPRNSSILKSCVIDKTCFFSACRIRPSPHSPSSRPLHTFRAHPFGPPHLFLLLNLLLPDPCPGGKMSEKWSDRKCGQVIRVCGLRFGVQFFCARKNGRSSRFRWN